MLQKTYIIEGLGLGFIIGFRIITYAGGFCSYTIYIYMYYIDIASQTPLQTTVLIGPTNLLHFTVRIDFRVLGWDLCSQVEKVDGLITLAKKASRAFDDSMDKLAIN